MHAVGIHSALAIKRQRKRRDEQKRARDRRYSIQSSESGDTQHSPHSSTRRRYQSHTQHAAGNGILDTKVVTSIGMLHIGVVFVVFGLFLIGAGILPDDFTQWDVFAKSTWWNELVCTGLFALGLGIFLLVLNKFIAKREEDDLEEYVQRALTRTRSGHRLERDCETGGLTTRHNRRSKSQHQLDSVVVQSGNGGVGVIGADNLAALHSNVHTPSESSCESNTSTTPHELNINGEMLLEKILEEDSIYGDDRCRDNISPLSNDKRYLLDNGNHHYNANNNTHITRI